MKRITHYNEGLGMAVLEDGTACLTNKILAGMCGVSIDELATLSSHPFMARYGRSEVLVHDYDTAIDVIMRVATDRSRPESSRKIAQDNMVDLALKGFREIRK